MFIKGSQLFPQCGISIRAIAMLDSLGVQYQTVNMVAVQGIRQAIKIYSDRPTIPQLCVRGEFVDGSDFMKEIFEREYVPTLLVKPGNIDEFLATT